MFGDSVLFDSAQGALRPILGDCSCLAVEASLLRLRCKKLQVQVTLTRLTYGHRTSCMQTHTMIHRRLTPYARLHPLSL